MGDFGADGTQPAHTSESPVEALFALLDSWHPRYERLCAATEQLKTLPAMHSALKAKEDEIFDAANAAVRDRQKVVETKLENGIELDAADKRDARFDNTEARLRVHESNESLKIRDFEARLARAYSEKSEWIRGVVENLDFWPVPSDPSLPKLRELCEKYQDSPDPRHFRKLYDQLAIFAMPTEWPRDGADRLVAAQKRRDHVDKEAAHACGVSVSTYRKWRRGVQGPSANFLRAALKYIGYTKV